MISGGWSEIWSICQTVFEKKTSRTISYFSAGNLISKVNFPITFVLDYLVYKLRIPQLKQCIVKWNSIKLLKDLWLFFHIHLETISFNNKPESLFCLLNFFKTFKIDVFYKFLKTIISLGQNVYYLFDSYWSLLDLLGDLNIG